MEVRSSAASQICCIFFNQKLHYRVHNSRPLVPLPREINPVHTVPCRFFKIYFNIILVFTPRPSVQVLPPKICMHFSSTCAANVFLDRKRCNFLQRPIISSPLGPSIFPSTLFLNIIKHTLHREYPGSIPS